jgi:citrate lyase subunit beta/citryl-CoA lyase
MESSNSADGIDRSSAALVRARSYLFVPATRPDRITKAFASGADAVIVDLEDAVALDAKDAARAALANALNPERPVIVRINAATTPWFAEDLRLCRAPGIAAVMLPKAESSTELRDVIAGIGRTLPLLPLVETARGLWNVLEIAQAAGVQRLAFGTIDFQLDLSLTGAGHEELAPFRAQLVLASRVAGVLSPIDGPTATFDDAQVVCADALRARRAGFGAKLCIHPQQVKWVNESFTPSVEETTWARRIVAAVQAAQGGVVAVDGKMVDRPVLALAEQILALAPGDV